MTKRLKIQAPRFSRWVRFCNGKRTGLRIFFRWQVTLHFLFLNREKGIWSIRRYHKIIWISIVERNCSKYSYWKWRPFDYLNDLKWTFMTFHFCPNNFSVFDIKHKNFHFRIWQNFLSKTGAFFSPYLQVSGHHLDRFMENLSNRQFENFESYI